jgi:hypothetical protein
MPELYWLKRPIAHRGLHDAARGIVEAHLVDGAVGNELDRLLGRERLDRGREAEIEEQRHHCNSEHPLSAKPDHVTLAFSIHYAAPIR